MTVDTKQEFKEVKQVIVMRNDLGMRKGKMIAQGAHTSIAFLSHGLYRESGLAISNTYCITLSPVRQAWFEGRFTKICVRVDSEAELLGIHRGAVDAGLTSHLIQDAGLTEFGGVLTYTCCAIGPDYANLIDPLTGHLKLL